MSTNALARPQSRRSILTALAAGTAAGGATLGVHTAVALTAAPDPVFALIAAEQRAHDAFEAAIGATGRAEDAFTASGFDRRPCVQVGNYVSYVTDRGDPIPVEKLTEEPVYAFSREDIATHYQVRSADPVTVDTGKRLVRSETVHSGRHDAALARFEADEAAIARARELCRVDAHMEAQDEADEAHRVAEAAVFSAVPTTAAGLLAMVALFEERELANVSGPLDEFLSGIFAAVRAIVREG